MITFVCRLRASDPAPIKPSAYPHRLRVTRWNCQIFLTLSPQVPRFVEYPNRILMMHSGSITRATARECAQIMFYEALVHPYFLGFSKCQIRAGMFYRRIHSDARGWRRTTTERCRRRLYFQQLESRRQSVWGLAQPVSVYDAATPHQERDTI